ncbi:MAG: 6-bladed beta-propeller [Candidatus Aureabacteria bacterium]|nr:6-bladed beta-propeller [Candidatus Auribacterota bacterium]
MRTQRLFSYLCITLFAAGCAGPQYYPIQGPPKHPVTIRSVNFEREIQDKDWKALVDVAADRSGNIVILDAFTHQLIMCDPQGAILRKIGESSFWKKTFPRPSSLAVDSEGRIFIVDTKEDSITIFDRTGAFSMKFGQKGSTAGSFKRPTGIDIDESRNLYVVDAGNNRVQKFDARGAFIGQIVSGPKVIEKIDISGAGGPIKFIAWPQFKQLRDVAVGPFGMFYILDEGICVVHAYSTEGAYLFSFGGRGRRSGTFEKPSGITVGAMGIVCVSDERRNTIQMFDPEGRFITSIGARGKGPGQFDQPQGLGASADGKLLVADKGNRRVQVFSYAVPVRQAAPSPKLEKAVRIAIFDFKNNNPQAQSRGYGEAISEMFITAFAKRPNFEVIERKQLRKVLDEIELDQSGVVENETAKKVGKVLGIDVALAGGIAAFAGSIQMDMRLLDVETGKVILADSLEANSEAQLRSLVNHEVGKLENSYVVRFYAPFPPAGISGEAWVRECRISWKPNEEPDLKEYRVYRAEKAEGPYTLIANTRKTEWVDKGLGDGTEYYYRIAALDITNLESNQSEPISVSTRGRPALGSIQVKENVEVKRSAFSWSENEEGVTGYIVYRSSTPDGNFTRVGESRTPNFSEKGFGDGETYYYKVAKKYRNGIESEPSKQFASSTKPRPSASQGLAAKSGLARRVSLEWKNPKENDIREFRIYRSDAEDGDYKKIASVKPGWISAPSYVDGGLPDNTTYFYKVQSVDKDDLESPMSEAAKAVTKPIPSVPRGFAAASGKARSVPLTWEINPEKDIKKYVVCSSDKETGPFREISQTSENKFNHTGLKDRSTYYYKLKAIDYDGLASDFSPVVSATTKPRPAQSRDLKAETGLVKSVRLTWAANPESDIAQYVVSRRAGRLGSFTDVGKSSSDSHLDHGLEDGKTYQYTIRAVDADGLMSDPSEKVEAATKPCPSNPASPTTSVKDGRITLTWAANAEPDIAGYEIFRSSSWDLLGAGKKIGEVTSPLFEDGTAQAGKKYTYSIEAFDKTGLHSQKSKGVSVQVPAQ